MQQSIQIWHLRSIVKNCVRAPEQPTNFNVQCRTISSFSLPALQSSCSYFSYASCCLCLKEIETIGKESCMTPRLQQVLFFLLLLSLQRSVYEVMKSVLQEDHERSCINNPCLVAAHHVICLFKRCQNVACVLNNEKLT